MPSQNPSRDLLQRSQPQESPLGFIWPAVVLLGGLLLTLWIQQFSRNGVLFSGDGGLKALLTQQLAQQVSAGRFSLDMALRLPLGEWAKADWIRALWQQGLYPFTPPYVYEALPTAGEATKYFITFPFTFPSISAPFYAFFGDRGLYIIPLLALWATWFRFWQIGRRAGWDTIALCVGLVALIFSAPLSFYGGTFWEHTLAVALAYWGVTALLYPPLSSAALSSAALSSAALSSAALSSAAQADSNRPLLAPASIPESDPESESGQRLPLAPALSPIRVLSSGVLIALSAWFRPEFLCLIAAVGGLAGISWLFPRLRLSPPITFTNGLLLVGAMACTLGVFFALNYGIYGHFLGIHALQIVEESTPASQISESSRTYRALWVALGRYFPVAVVIGFMAFFGPELKKAVMDKAHRFKGYRTPNVDALGLAVVNKTLAPPRPERFLLALSVLYALSVPLIVPAGAGGKQWGFRFFLILVPLLSTVLAEQLRSHRLRPWVYRTLLVATAVALALGIQANTVNGLLRPFHDARTQSTSLLANYEPIAPAIAALQQRPNPWIAMSHQFVAQQLWSALPEKVFFRTETVESLKQLATALISQNEREFLYICYPHQDCPVPSTAPEQLTLAGGNRLVFEDLGKQGKYPFYSVKIQSPAIAPKPAKPNAIAPSN
jgi:hypothetical protein